MSDTPLIELRNLEKHFTLSNGLFGRNKVILRAVDGVDLLIRRGETLGLVGESGCGKSTLARTLIRLLRRTSGEMLFDGSDIGKLGERALAPYRRRMQMIFQDPYASLNGRMTVRALIAEPLEIAGIGDDASRRAGLRTMDATWSVTLVRPRSAVLQCFCIARCFMRSRTSAPETGLAVVAMRMIECVRSTRYLKSPSVARGHQSATVWAMAWKRTKKATARWSEATRAS